MRTRPRGSLSGPFSVWIYRPDIAEPANQLTNCFRVSPTLDKRLIELIVLLMCRDATAKYAWSAHVNLAREASLRTCSMRAIAISSPRRVHPMPAKCEKRDAEGRRACLIPIRLA